jgi:hypothetical protein
MGWLISGCNPFNPAIMIWDVSIEEVMSIGISLVQLKES